MTERERLIAAGHIRPAVNGRPVKVWGRDKLALWDAGFTVAATRRIPPGDAENYYGGRR